MKDKKLGLVYAHRRLDTNKIFYIGISNSNKRPFIKTRRSRNSKLQRFIYV